MVPSSEENILNIQWNLSITDTLGPWLELEVFLLEVKCMELELSSEVALLLRVL